MVIYRGEEKEAAPMTKESEVEGETDGIHNEFVKKLHPGCCKHGSLITIGQY